MFSFPRTELIPSTDFCSIHQLVENSETFCIDIEALYDIHDTSETSPAVNTVWVPRGYRGDGVHAAHFHGVGVFT
jgi:hypothetical protein